MGVKEVRYILSFSLLLFLPLLSIGESSIYAQSRNGSKTKTATAKSKTSVKTSTKQKPVKVDQKTKLKNEKAATEQKRKQSQAELLKLNKNVKANLDSVLILDHQIGRQQTSIDSLNHEIGNIGARIDTLNTLLVKLNKDLQFKKKHYAKAVVAMRRNRSVQNKFMFIFSADNFSQLIRRMRYMREYSTFQKAQGELLKEKQEEVRNTQNELLAAKAQKEQNLRTVESQKRSLQGLKSSCEAKVNFLNKNIATVQQQIDQYKKKEASLNAEIDRIIQTEIEAARRAEAERKRKAEEARKKAEAEAQKMRDEAAKARIDEQVKEIGKYDPDIKSVDDLMKSENYDGFIKLVKMGIPMVEAYRYANIDKGNERTSAMAKQQALNSVNSRSHLEKTATRGAGSKPVPSNVREQYLAFNPNLTDSEISAHYNKYLNNGG